MLLKKFLGLCKRESYLSQILKDSRMREILLGVDRKPPMIDAKTEADANKVILYSKSSGYDAYARELWKTVISYVEVLTNPNLKPDDVNFYRGCLTSTLDDLRISYKAFIFMEGQREKDKIPLNGSAASLRH